MLSIQRHLIVAAGGALALLLAGWWVYSLGGDNREYKLRAEWDRERLDWMSKGAASLAAERATEKRWREEQERRMRELDQKNLLAIRDRDAVSAAGERLRIALTEARLRASACRSSEAPAAAPAGPPASSPADMLAYVQRRLDEATDGTVEFADGSHRAGRACEIEYDATR